MNTRFIWPTFSPHSTLVIFVNKKNRLLHLYINFCRLDCITKKNCYLLLFTSDLLDLCYKAQVYTKIDLHYMYHLVYISKDDKQDTAFLSYASPLVQKLHSHSDIASQPYKPIFYSGHLSYNMPYDSNAIIWIFYPL